MFLSLSFLYQGVARIKRQEIILVSKTETDKLSESLELNKSVDVGEFKASDTDNDGLYDKFILTLNREELEKDFFLDKTIESV